MDEKRMEEIGKALEGLDLMVQTNGPLDSLFEKVKVTVIDKKYPWENSWEFEDKNKVISKLLSNHGSPSQTKETAGSLVSSEIRNALDQISTAKALQSFFSLPN